MEAKPERGHVKIAISYQSGKEQSGPFHILILRLVEVVGSILSPSSTLDCRSPLSERILKMSHVLPQAAGYGVVVSLGKHIFSGHATDAESPVGRDGIVFQRRHGRVRKTPELVRFIQSADI